MEDFFADIDWSRWLETLWTTSVRVLVIIVFTYIALRIARRIFGPALRATISAGMEGQSQVEIDKRVDTLSHLGYRTISFIAFLIALLTVLPEFGINVGALLAGAGVLGIAIGIGSQSLVRDVLSGFFVLIESQYSRGDVISVAGVSGQVEDVSLRRTLLRDLDGAVHSVPNGQITVSSNLTRHRSRVNTLVGVSEQEDLDHVIDILNRTGDELARDPRGPATSWARRRCWASRC